MIKKEDYHHALELITKRIEDFPQKIRPSVIYHAGNLNNPGVSDIDLLVGFKDEFCYLNK